MRANRRGYTLIEIAVASAIFSLIVYILMAATSLARQYFLADQLSHALQGAVVLGSELEEDLRQAVRDPSTGQALKVSTDGGLSISFYRALIREGQMEIASVPTRWSLRESKDDTIGYLSRTTFDVQKSAWETRNFEWAPIPMRAPDGAPTGTNPIGFSLIGDSGKTGESSSLVQTVVLTVMARQKPTELAGGKQDRVSLQIAVAVPQMPVFASYLFQPLRRLEEIPAN